MGVRRPNIAKQPTTGSLGEHLERLNKLRDAWGLEDGAARRGDAAPLWFRGHADADWKLTPKLYRPEYRDSDEHEIRHEFKSRALQLIQGRLPADEWEWYFLMQHYGVPTRLLDWTENALIAMYFAVEGHRADKDAAVWALDPTWLNRKLRRGIKGVMLHDWSEAQSYLRELEDAFSGVNITAQLPAAIEPPHVDRRLVAQSSRFVIFGKTQNLMRTKVARNRRDLRVEMMRIPRTEIPGLQRDLINYGITAATVFPDLSGLCQEICSKWKAR